MILTGTEIQKAVSLGSIAIAPFDPHSLNPNSYNYRLGSKLLIPSVNPISQIVTFHPIEIPVEGYVLLPGCMVLGHTLESIGSSSYAMSLIGRSSVGRYGLFLQVSANLGHTTSNHCWTLELVATQPIRLYAEMKIGQVSFWQNEGQISCLGKTYARFSAPTERRVS